MWKNERHWRHSAALLAMALLVVPVLAGAGQGDGPRGGDGGVPGRYAAGHTSFVLEQESGRPVAVDVWYPSDRCDIGPRTDEAVYRMDPFFDGLPDTSSADWEALGYDPAYEEPRPSKHGPFPLLVYSSGWSFPAWANLFLGTRLANHGYVVAVVQHYGEGAFPWHPFARLSTNMYNRPRDLTFILTELLARNHRRRDRLGELIDPRRVAAGGHSLGGYAALALTAGDDTICDSKELINVEGPPPPEECGATAVDPRFSGIVALEASVQFMRFEEIERVPVPSLVMGGAVERQSPVLDQWRSFIARPHAAITGRASFRVDLQGTDHFSYSSYCDGVTMLHDRGAISEDDWNNYYGVFFCEAPLPAAEAHHLIDRFVVSFLDTHLRRPPSSDGRASLGRLDAEEPLAELFRTERCDAELGDPETLFTYKPHRGQCEVGVKNPTSWF